MPDSEKPPPRDPRPLSTEYHKAHKQLMLWATILLIWELIGVDLSKAKDAGGNIGPIVTALKSPQAVPWALTGLVIYFLFKCSIEWAQCEAARRKVRVARIDFVSAWVVAVAAVTLYIGQAISRVQFADLIAEPIKGKSLSLGFLTGLMLGAGIAVVLKESLSRKHYRSTHRSNIDPCSPSRNVVLDAPSGQHQD